MGHASKDRYAQNRNEFLLYSCYDFLTDTEVWSAAVAVQ